MRAPFFCAVGQGRGERIGNKSACSPGMKWRKQYPFVDFLQNVPLLLVYFRKFL